MRRTSVCTLLFALAALRIASATLAAELAEGDAAPEFSLAGTDDKTYKLADFKDKQVVVVAWFPKAKTRGCTAECKSMKESGAALREFDVAYFAASCDPVELNKEFAEDLKLDFPILSDITAEVAKAYGVYHEERKVAQRWTFYIGKDGKLLYVDKGINAANAGKDIADRLGKLGVAKKGAGK